MVAHGRPQQNYPAYQHIAAITSTTNTTQAPNYQPQPPQRPAPYYPPLYQQPYPRYNPQQLYPQPYYPPQAPQQPRPPRNQFPQIPMLYGDLLPSLLARNLVQLRAPPRVPNPIPPWYRADRTCAFHQNASGHDIEHCYPLKEEVLKLIHSKELTFTDPDPVVQNNPLPPHGPAVNMIQVCPEDGLILNARDIKTPLVPIHIRMCEATMFSHNHGICTVCFVDPRRCVQVQNDVQGLLDRRELMVTRRGKDVCVVTPVFKTREPLVTTPPSNAKSVRTPLVICHPGPTPYASQKAIPYKYECTILKTLNIPIH